MSPFRLPLAPLLDEKRGVSYTIVFGIWAMVFVYCVLHDQYLIRIAPEHFTEWHPPLWGIEGLTLLALAWGFRASVGPGLILGLAALFLGRAGSRPKVAPGTMLKALPWGILATETAGLLAGAWVWRTGRPLFPLEMYPDFSKPLLITQTIQLTCYLAGGVSGAVFLGWIAWQRRGREEC
jgi:hypothetical protein